jgi:hypothetical protein
MKSLALCFLLMMVLASPSNALDKDEVAAADLGVGDDVETDTQPDVPEPTRPRVKQRNVAGNWRSASGGTFTELHYHDDGSFDMATQVRNGLGGYEWQRVSGTWSVDGSTLTEYRTNGQRRQFTIITLAPHRLLQLKNSAGQYETYIPSP